MADQAAAAAKDSAYVPPVGAVDRIQGGTDRSPWNWLLLLPIFVPLVVVLFNSKTPTLFGFPRFYWLQLAFILLGVGTTTLVYQMTKKPSPPSSPVPGADGR